MTALRLGATAIVSGPHCRRFEDVCAADIATTEYTRMRLQVSLGVCVGCCLARAPAAAAAGDRAKKQVEAAMQGLMRGAVRRNATLMMLTRRREGVVVRLEVLEVQREIEYVRICVSETLQPSLGSRVTVWHGAVESKMWDQGYDPMSGQHEEAVLSQQNLQMHL